MCKERDDVFENLPRVNDLVEEMLEEDRIPLDVSVVENLLEQLRLAKEELNDCHVRDAEMEGWMAIPRNRYLRLLGLELENCDLTRRNETLEDELEACSTPDFIIQPPDEGCKSKAEPEFEFEPPKEGLAVGFAGITEERYADLLEGSVLDRRAASEEIFADLKRVRGVIRNAHHLLLDWPVEENSLELSDEEYEDLVFHLRERGIGCRGTR